MFDSALRPTRSTLLSRCDQPRDGRSATTGGYEVIPSIIGVTFRRML